MSDEGGASGVQERIEFLRGEAKVVRVDRFEQRHLEQPTEEVHHVDLPPREIIRTNMRTVPHSLTVDRFEEDPHSFCSQVEYVDENRVVEQIVEVPRDVEEIVSVDVPKYELEENPVYIPYVASTRVVQVQDPHRQVVIDDHCWVPKIRYNALQDPMWEKVNFPGFLSESVYKQRHGTVPTKLSEVTAHSVRNLLVEPLKGLSSTQAPVGSKIAGEEALPPIISSSTPVPSRAQLQPIVSSRPAPLIGPSAAGGAVTTGAPVLGTNISGSLGFIPTRRGTNKLAWAV